MKKFVSKRLANVLIVAGVLLLAIGLGYEAVNYPWRTLMARVGMMEMEEELPDPAPLKEYAFVDRDMAGGTAEVSNLPADASGLPLSRPQKDLTLVGAIKLPKIGISENIVDGTEEELLYGVGHLRGSAYPGEEGNCVLSGHRNYVFMHPFMHLPMMEIGDRITVSFIDQGTERVYVYEIYDIFKVKPDEVWVTQPQDGEEKMLTLLTCTPVPSYTERLICWARLVESES